MIGRPPSLAFVSIIRAEGILPPGSLRFCRSRANWYPAERNPKFGLSLADCGQAAFGRKSSIADTRLRSHALPAPLRSALMRNKAAGL